MAQIEIIPRRRASQVFEGTPDEIAQRLRDLSSTAKLTLIIPGEELPPTQIATQEHEPIKTETNTF